MSPIRIDDEHRRRLLVHRHHLGPGGRVDEVVTDRVATGPSGGEFARVVASEAERLAVWLGDERVSWRYPTARTKALSGAATVGEVGRSGDRVERER